MSAGMKNKIRAGEYTFPENDWNMVSQEAKDLIRMMLTVEPANRPTINQILENRWLSEYNSVLQAPLNTPQVLAEARGQWSDVTAEIIAANDYNRLEDTDDDLNNSITFSITNNLLFWRRQRRRGLRDVV
ncbi:unnamed protein product [Didymodactylos carnosus]|uniref:Uncharacterized protein n=1 Tax=Didymodactylos carnosus TaxID=1234261 RepID=A0A8S2VJ57_9BILA|nr:unnamed protein product [Didymodactylos carnosus]CAF4388553.1 unnamed protein product [Didymodactylos carnosus]